MASQVYERGHITILNRTLLEATACGCHDTITAEYERVVRTPMRRVADAMTPQDP